MSFEARLRIGMSAFQVTCTAKVAQRVRRLFILAEDLHALSAGEVAQHRVEITLQRRSRLDYRDNDGFLTTSKVCSMIGCHVHCAKSFAQQLLPGRNETQREREIE